MKRVLYSVVLAAVVLGACTSGQPNASSPVNSATAGAQKSAPAIPLAGRVTDAAHILSPEQQSKLSRKLEELERSTKHQMAIATVPSLGGRDVADFARDLANSWGVGRKGYNDGVLLLVAPNELKIRIAVGYGLEKTLTDDVCQGIIDKSILPEFRKGDLPAGIEAGTDALIARLE